MNLSPEEINLVLRHRAENQKKEDISTSSLELQFKQTLEEAQKKIKDQLGLAEIALNEAIRTSEASGIPFRWAGPGMPSSRLYIPKESMMNLWGWLGHERVTDMLPDLGVYFGFNFEGCDEGWEYWRASALMC